MGGGGRGRGEKSRSPSREKQKNKFSSMSETMETLGNDAPDPTFSLNRALHDTKKTRGFKINRSNDNQCEKGT